jgi:hypothetical protein
MLTSVMWTLGHMHHEQDLHWLECESDCKKWFPPHLAMCRTSWWKSGPNNCAWLTSWWKSVFVVVFRLRTTFIPTKHNFHLIKSKGTKTINFKTYQNDQWKGFIGFQTIASMSEVILYCRFFYIFLKGQILGDVPFYRSLHILLFTLQKLKDTSVGDVCGFNCLLVLASMPKPIFPHQVYIRERWLCQILDLDGLGQWSLPHALNYLTNNPIVRVPNLWKPMEFLHKFINCNKPNLQSH